MIWIYKMFRLYLSYRQAYQTDSTKIKLTKIRTNSQKMMKTFRLLKSLKNNTLRNVSLICEGNINTFQQNLEI
jgi:hypothetical protein